MRKVVGFAGTVMIIHGVVGLVHHVTGWFRWSRLLGVVEGYEVYTATAFVVVGFAVCAAAERADG